MSKDTVSLYAVGDVAAYFKNPETMFQHTAAILKEADILFAENERHYTDRFTERDLVPGVPFTEIAPTRHAAALKLGHFDVLGFASNHCMDLGPTALLETIEVIRKQGIGVIGVGRNIEEARKPAILERKGTKVAILAYASVIRPGWEATADRPGCAPMRAMTFYRQLDYQPATPPQIISLPFPEDVAAVKEDIRKVRPLADVIVLSFHWGVHYVRGAIAQYQKEVAHAAIDAGCDLILGHHPHMLKGIEVYKGKVIFYSMGNFAFDLPLQVKIDRHKDTAEKHLYHTFKCDPGYADACAWPAESLKSMLVKCRIDNRKIERLSFLPILINNKAQPVPVTDPHGVKEALDNIEDLSLSQGLETRFTIENGEIVVGV